jgi:hexosaminidase
MSFSLDLPGDRLRTLIPQPAAVTPGDGIYKLTAETILIATPQVMEVAVYLAELLSPALGTLAVTQTSQTGQVNQPGGLSLCLVVDPELGSEGYELEITSQGIALRAPQTAGLFYAVQTLRQLLPPALQTGELLLPTAVIRDYPRFAWRGAMLDVARHFFGPAEIKHFIDLLAYYKINRLHLHLTDDQGWRLMIASWPRLAEYGGQTAVNRDPGGYYTQAEYREIVAHASSRWITIVPEIDLPGHTNAALASYPELNCDDQAPALNTGMAVGFSSLCLAKPLTIRFLDDVIGEVAALTPGAYLHIGGDEAHSTPKPDYITFIEMIQGSVNRHGKTMVGWNEISQANLSAPVIVQFWAGEISALPKGAQVIFSPAQHTYLDMKYDQETRLGLQWAGLVNTRQAYEWDPETLLAGLDKEGILGVEAPLWTETVRTVDELEFMVFPRLIGHAEIGWSPRSGRHWETYAARLGAHGPRLAALKVNFYPDPAVPWIKEIGP